MRAPVNRTVIASLSMLLAAASLVPARPAMAASSPRVVNVTTDSAPGWTPSPEQERLAERAVKDFLAALDGGRFADAYAALSDVNKRSQPFAEFSSDGAKFNAMAGSVIERRIVKVTWTKDPAQAPAPGVYAAVDLVSRFAQVDRHCGYVSLYHAPTGGPFQVARVEVAYLDNATARSIAAAKSAMAVEEVWASVSANCPNYPGQQVSNAPPLPESPGSSTGYPTVAAALASLRSRPGAYPSAVKRQVVQEGGLVSVKMSVLCESTKAACDDLVRSFLQLNATMEKSLRARR
jgi:hypothetical protein